MKACLDDNELLQVLVSDVGEYADSRAHLAGCSRCSGAYQKIAADTGIITSALTRAADRLDYRENAIARAAKSGALARFRYGVRSAVVFSGAMAFGGAAAFALMIALGWRPTTMKNEIARASAGNPSARVASASGDTNQVASGNAKQVVAEDNSDNLPTAGGGLYNAEAVTSDPLSGLVGNGSMSGANEDGGEDLLFCVPGEDGTICSPSGGQG
jgi:hypothetical protein